MSSEFIVKAISQGNYDLVDNILIALNVDQHTYASTIEHDFGSLLYFACKHHQKKIAKLLFEKGADINFSKNYCNPPLYSAIEAGHLDMVAFLLENGFYREGKNFSCLETAVLNRNVAMVAKLLAYGAKYGRYRI
ncbi:ankyrin repeat domain-containing protein [Rickettsia australis]|uniref:Uncharacterized protein n=1 Tax=Rickettsia australis (strain Cutlack) TaxID=1105110 RepID=H8K8F5_RICAC|nr:ankyrin repeat domain-containing protein [Rickettsia australis]AFC71548.1 hypothetical protein MC5_06540 [Rickettsia australis str. Cutlack]